MTTQQSLDLVSLYAYADKAHVFDREAWRGFLGFVLPLLLGADAGEIEELLESAVTKTPDILLKEVDEPHDAASFVRVISVNLAEVLGIPLELGLAAFLDCNLPTRTIHFATGKQNATEQTLVAEWLGRFSKLNDEKRLSQLVQEWRQVLVEYDFLEDANGFSSSSTKSEQNVENDENDKENFAESA